MSRLRQIGSFWVRLLRELADESAYQRHLEAHGLQESPEAWRRFWEERLRARFSHPKCC